MSNCYHGGGTVKNCKNRDSRLIRGSWQTCVFYPSRIFCDLMLGVGGFFYPSSVFSDLMLGRGLFHPSSVLAEYVTCLESVFRERVPPAIQGTRIGLNFMSNMWDVSSARHVTCSKHSCLPADSHIMVQLYFIVGVHHYLHEQNRQMQQPHATKNKENITSEEDLAASTSNGHCATKQHSLQERQKNPQRKPKSTSNNRKTKLQNLRPKIQCAEGKKSE